MGTLVHEGGQGTLLEPEADGTQPRDCLQRADHLTERTDAKRDTNANRVQPIMRAAIDEHTRKAPSAVGRHKRDNMMG